MGELLRLYAGAMSEHGFTHLDETGAARMVDVSGKPATKRTAVARSMVQMEPATAAAIADQSLGKGDVLAVARVAGIQAAKKTSELIPLCHPLALSAVKVEFALSESDLEITATVETVGPTGVEMEALTAVSVAALTIYDMCKAIDRGMTISNTQLLHKAGGKSGDWSRA
jgi:cyclic pyranopterin phosphate synthase